MKTFAVIPARFAASRFPGKLMKKIGDKTMIRIVYENAVATKLFDDVLVVTDSEEIFDEISSHGGSVKMSLKEHISGSDRIAESIADIDVDVIVNIQGDEPFVQSEPLKSLINSFTDTDVQVASLMKRFTDEEDPNNPNLVKVVCNNKMDALYFSRSPIPFKRNSSSHLPFFRHIGVYAFKKSALIGFTQWPAGVLEETEMLEQLRYLENGISIRMVETTSTSIGIDTPEDLEKAQVYFRERGKEAKS